MAKKKELILINEENIKNKIYTVRGQKVMLDSDLAEIYGYSTKDFNRQVKNNIDKFPSDFMFRLTTNEVDNLIRCKNFTGSHRNERYYPYVFTESGIYMLMTVLKGPLAIKQSIMLIRLFKGMKDTLNDNGLLPSNILRQVELKTLKHDEDIKEIKTDLDKVMDNFIDPNTYKEFLILDGMKFTADTAYKKIFRQANKSIIYIDDYIGFKTLELLMFVKNGVDINIISDNAAKEKLKQYMIDDFMNQKKNIINLFKSLNKCHDRFIILDFNTSNEKIYYCGASIKDAGKKISVISLFNSNDLLKNRIKSLLKNPKLILK